MCVPITHYRQKSTNRSAPSIYSRRFFFSSTSPIPCNFVAVLSDSRPLPDVSRRSAPFHLRATQSSRLSVHDHATARRTGRTNLRRSRPPSPLRVSDQRDIGDPERQQQRGKSDPERVRQLRRRVPGRRRPAEDRFVRRPGHRQTAATVVALVAAAAALVAASHAHAAAVGPALRPAVRADQVGRGRGRPPEQRLRPAVAAAVVADILARQPHLAEPHRGPGHITFTRVFAF